MKIRLYLDEDTLQVALTRALRAQGIELVTATEAGMVARPDEDHLSYATDQGLTLHSFNIRDYANLNAQFLARGSSHGGIILAQQNRYSIGEHVRRLVLLTAALSAEDMKDRVEYLGA